MRTVGMDGPVDRVEHNGTRLWYSYGRTGFHGKRTSNMDDIDDSQSFLVGKTSNTFSKVLSEGH